MIRCVVFDFDGTLVDSNQLKRKVFFEIASRHPGYGEHTMKQILQSVEGDRKTVFQAYVGKLAETGTLLDADELTELYSREVDRKVAAAREIPGASELLQRLKKQGKAIHLSSGTPRESLLTILNLRGWMHHFDGIHGFPKRKVETLQYIMQIERLSPENIAVVGDRQDDAYAAETAGCHFIPVGNGTSVSGAPEKSICPLDQVSKRLKWISHHGEVT